jgi:hypothetical protein
MAAIPGYGSVIKIPGTSTAFTGEATTLVSGTTYQINTSAKRVLDPAVAVTVKDGGVAVAVSSVDWLFGKVTLSSAPAGAVTVDASYLPMLTVAQIREFSIKVSANMLETTNMDTGTARARLKGLATAEVHLLTYDQRETDQDPGAGTQTWASNFAGAVMVEIRPNNDTYGFRGWTILESVEDKAAVDGIKELDLNFVGHARSGTAGTGSTNTGSAFGWGTF